MQFALPAPKPEKRRRPAPVRKVGPTALSPIALGSSQPPKFMQEIAAHNQVVARADNKLRVLEQLPVGPELAAGLYRLRGEELGCDGAVRATALWQKLASWASAEAMITTTEALNSLDYYLTTQQLRAPLVIGQEIACATRVSMASAMAQVNLTVQVGNTLPKTWVALDRGEITLAHVRTLARVTQNCTPRVAAEVEERILPAAKARGWTPADVKKHGMRVLAAIDPEGAAERAKRAKADSDVTFCPCPEETATVTGYGDAATMRRVYDTINNAAADMRREGDDRSVGVRRCDALAKFVLGSDASNADSSNPAAAGTGARRPSAQALIAMPADTVLGGDAPGELAGYGPVCAATARDLATDAIWRKLILDPGTGETLDLGRSSYRPSEPLLRFIKARDWTCRFPGCNQPAVACDCDHRHDHHDGGPTDRRNLQLLCRLHHNLKTCKIWSALVDETGQISWTSPLGHTYSVEPHRLLDLLDEPPEDPAEPLVPDQSAAEPDPPVPDEPPPISFDELEEYLDTIDELERDEWFRANANYDRYRHLGLIA